MNRRALAIALGIVTGWLAWAIAPWAIAPWAGLAGWWVLR